MSPQERVSRLRVWQETLLELDARLRELMDLTGGVDGPLQNAININFVGIELDPEYVEIARARIEWARPRQFGLQLEPAA